MKGLVATVSVAIFICAGVGCGRSSSPMSPSALSTPTQPSSPTTSSISSISPISGGVGGATLVQIRGTGLRNTSSVMFGGVAATRVGWSPDGTLVSATTPPGKPGPVDVVLNLRGQGSTLISGFTYGPATPLLVTAISQAVGPTAGGTYLTITGEGLLAGATMRLGGADAMVLYQRIGTSVDLATRPHPAGRVDVVVTNPDGQVARLPGGYTYAPPPLSDFNGVWEGRVGHEEEGSIRIAVQNNVIVSVSCGNAVNVNVAPASTVTGEFAVMDNGHVQMTGGLVRANRAEGTINLAGCTTYETGWFANRP